MNGKKNVALLYGGYSNEAKISYKSAQEVYGYLDNARFNIFPIEITNDNWYYNKFGDDRVGVDRNNFTFTIYNNSIKIDVCFIALHGTPGEDGKIQGYLDMLNIPYISVSAIESAVTFNKRYTVAIANYYGINTAKHEFILKGENFHIERLKKNLSLPVFVKPCKSGSSIGVTLLQDWADLMPALETAFREDDEVIIEERINGAFYTLGVFKRDNQIIVTPALNFFSDSKEFLDFASKTAFDDFEIKVEKDSPEYEILSEFAKKLHRIFKGQGIFRIDAVLNEIDGKPYLLEVNTIPGMSKHSAFPRMIKEMGWNLSDFYTSLITEAMK